MTDNMKEMAFGVDYVAYCMWMFLDVRFLNQS